MRVQQPEPDEIVRVGLSAKERSCVVDSNCHAFGRVRAVRMSLSPNLDDCRIDLNSFNLRRTRPEGGGHVVTGSGTDHQHSFALPDQFVRQHVMGAPYLVGGIQVRRARHACRIEIHHDLVSDVVDEDHFTAILVEQSWNASRQRELLIGGPDRRRAIVPGQQGQGQCADDRKDAQRFGVRRVGST